MRFYCSMIGQHRRASPIRRPVSSSCRAGCVIAKSTKVHACLEATGGWSEDLALVLHEAGHVVSLVNPARIKAFARSEMLRTKTDLIDAALIARFCRMHAPEPWTPPALEIRVLQGLIRRYQSLVQMRTEEQNRLQAPMIASVVKASIEATLAHLDREIERVDREIEQLFDQYPPLRRQRDLLTSIPGIGETTAARILGEMPNIAEFRDVKAVAAYAGLSPRHYESGSIRRPSRIAKTGNAKSAHRALLSRDLSDAVQSTASPFCRATARAS